MGKPSPAYSNGRAVRERRSEVEKSLIEKNQKKYTRLSKIQGASKRPNVEVSRHEKESISWAGRLLETFSVLVC